MAWTNKGSLKGPQGEKGEKGDTGETGPQGPQGEQGEKGDTGEQGIGITCGEGAPSGTSRAGELYIDTSTGDLYEYEE